MASTFSEDAVQAGNPIANVDKTEVRIFVRRPRRFLASVMLDFHGVRVRITTREESSGVVVQFDGTLVAEATAELARVCAGIQGLVRLDLAGIRTVDDQGVQLLRTLAARKGIRCCNN